MNWSRRTFQKGVLLGALFLLLGCGERSLTPLSLEALPPNLPKIKIEIANYCPSEGSAYIDFFATNNSIRIEQSEIQLDFDRDGIPNDLEWNAEFNISPQWYDTNLDGYSDLLMYLVSMPASSQQNLRYCPNPGQDTDQDGLNDCEEDFLGTEITDFDTDHDGLSDYLEVRNGLNPRDDFDSYRDPDLDGSDSITEIKMNTPPLETNTPFSNYFAFQYDVDWFLHEETNSDCYDLFVSNIPVNNVSNGNLIVLQFVEEDAGGRRWMWNHSIVAPRDTLDGTEYRLEYEDIR